MFSIDIPGTVCPLSLHNLVCDFNGTLACDGTLLPDVSALLSRMSECISIHVVTADTFGTVRNQLHTLPLIIHILPTKEQDRAKEKYVVELGADQTACIGNGCNDALMLARAALGICVILQEGAHTRSLQSADIVCCSITDALTLFLHPKRLIATLRR